MVGLQVQLVTSAIASDPNAERAWLDDNDPLSAFATTVFAVMEKSLKLSSQGLLRRLTLPLKRRTTIGGLHETSHHRRSKLIGQTHRK